jgi:chromate transporter
MAFVAQLAGVHFAITLIVGGLAYVLSRRNRAAAYVLITAGAIGIVTVMAGLIPSLTGQPVTGSAAAVMNPSWLALFWSGLRSGLLTFGGAYTVIPYLQNDAVAVGHWMTNSQFLDGLALSGILPAPLVIFGTFVGYLGGGPMGAVALTLGIFLPAFSFTLIGHDLVERLVENTALHNVLDGVTAGVVGLISATALLLLRAAITDLPSFAIFAAALLVLFLWKSRMATPVVVLGAAGMGLLLSLLLQ